MQQLQTVFLLLVHHWRDFDKYKPNWRRFLYCQCRNYSRTTIDGSALTGVLTVGGNDAGTTVTGGAGKDVLQLVLTTVTYNGGANNDQLTATVAKWLQPVQMIHI